MGERRGARGCVLLAEDDDDYREILTDYLRHVDFEVHAFASGHALLDTVLSQPPPFVVLTDLFMPGVSGFDVIAALRTADLLPVVPVIAHSAAAWDAFPEPDVFPVVKPASLPELELVLDCLCGDAARRARAASVRLRSARRQQVMRAVQG